MSEKDCDNNSIALQESLGYTFQNEKFLEIALNHKSYVHELPQTDVEDNERFEFLGDAVLGLVISDYLIHQFPSESEGFLSKLKGFIVSKSFLFEIAKELNLGDYLKLGRGEANSGGRFKPSLLVDSFEAIIAGIYLDGGLNKAYNFIIEHMGDKINELINNSYIPDYKSIFQEYTQMEFGCIPIYKLVSENGEQHDPEFEVNIFVKDKCLGFGKGKSKRQAEQEAARSALINLKVNGVF
jgi:ribonuclease-3